MTQIILSGLISVSTFIILFATHVDVSIAQAGSSSGPPSPNVPKGSGLQSKEGEAGQKHEGKGISGEQPPSKDKKSSKQQQDEQMERKHSGR